MENLTFTSGQLVMVGDFNLHVDDPRNSQAMQFISMLDSFNLKQHILEQTHKHGHILDLVITRKDDDVVSDIMVLSYGEFSPHSAIHMYLKISRPDPCRKEISFRKFRAIDKDVFRTDILETSLIQSPNVNLDEVVCQYDRDLRLVIEKHAPQKRQVITIRSDSLWYTDEVRHGKHLRRKLERHWRR
jgi:ribosomal protein S8